MDRSGTNKHIVQSSLTWEDNIVIRGANLLSRPATIASFVWTFGDNETNEEKATDKAEPTGVGTNLDCEELHTLRWRALKSVRGVVFLAAS